MNIDLLAFDLDGTTLNSKKEISAENKSAFREAYASGILLVPCTGRSIAHLSDALVSLLNELGFAAFPYIITDNGAQAYALPERELLLTRNMSEQTALAVLEESRKYRAVTYCSFGPEGATDSRGVIWENGIGQEMINGYAEKWYVPVVDLEGLIHWNCGALKISMNFYDGGEFREAFEKFSSWPELQTASGDVKSIEVMTKGIHKGETLRFVSRRAGVPMERIMAIGDNYNDMEMIGSAGWGVAMGNAVPELKEKAAWVTAANDEDGLALAVRKMLFERGQAG